MTWSYSWKNVHLYEKIITNWEQISKFKMLIPSNKVML